MRFAIVVALGFAVVVAPRSSTAQCSANASSCVRCHETQGLRPVLSDAQPWHVDHGFGDLCSACHGGAPGEEDQTRAHRGRREPLVAIDAACAGCHRDDAAARAAGYQAVLDARPPTASTSSPPPGPPPIGRSPRPADPILAAVAVALALALVLAVRRPRLSAAGPALAAAVRAPTWSPYAAGALLGAIVAIAAVFLGRPLAASSAVDKLAAYLGRWWFADAPYYRYQMAPGITWQVWLLVGVLGGAFASAWWSGQARWRWLPDAQWTPRFGPSRGRRLVLAFLGAVLVQVGAGIAGGCTSGLAISGGAVLAPAAFLFMAGMFTGGIPTAWLWYRRAP